MNKSEITIETYNRSAQKYYTKFKKMNLYDDTYDLFCPLIERTDAHILEITCGPGNITEYLLNRIPGLKITGIDLAKEMIALAKRNVSAADFKVLD